MKRSLYGFFLLAGAPLVCSADPYVGYIYPSSIQAGTTNRLIIGGQALNGAQKYHFTKSGIKVLKVEHVPGFPPPVWQQRRHLVKWLDGIAAGKREEPPLPNDPHLDEWRTNPWWSALDTLDVGQLALVEHDLEFAGLHCRATHAPHVLDEVLAAHRTRARRLHHEALGGCLGLAVGRGELHAEGLAQPCHHAHEHRTLAHGLSGLRAALHLRDGVEGRLRANHAHAATGLHGARSAHLDLLAREQGLEVPLEGGMVHGVEVVEVITAVREFGRIDAVDEIVVGRERDGP